jgi:hypothetical protein
MKTQQAKHGFNITLTFSSEIADACINFGQPALGAYLQQIITMFISPINKIRSSKSASDRSSVIGHEHHIQRWNKT